LWAQLWHGISYQDYNICFYDMTKTIIADSWDDTVKTTTGKSAVTHVLVRRFIGDPGPRGATSAVPVKDKKL